MTVTPRIKVVKKGTQTTFTESEVLTCLHGLINHRYPRGILYLFPTKNEVTDFSSSRFNPLIHDNPDTIGCYVRETNRANLRRIGSGFLYFRSGRLTSEIAKQAKSSSQLKSLPADHAVHDEYDEMHGRIDEFVDGRLSKSEIGTKTYLANPTLPDYGIAAKFELSDQEYWHIKCQHCGAWTCLDDPDSAHPFPECFHEMADGSVIRACSKCGLDLDPRFGDWVPKKPGITDILGFSIGHPSIYWIKPADLLRDFRTTKDIANFTRLKLGREYIEATNRLSIEDVLALCSNSGILSNDLGPCFMGVDQGKDLHVVISKNHSQKAGEIVHLSVYLEWEDLDSLMRNFNVARCVVDALPETRNARAFATRFPGRVYLNYYNVNQKGSYKWDEKTSIVQCNRTESLDASHRQIAEEEVVLPKDCEITQEFAQHLHNVAKKLEEDDETGSKRYVYVKLGPDHFRHAFNYETMARQFSSTGFFAGTDLS